MAESGPLALLQVLPNSGSQISILRLQKKKISHRLWVQQYKSAHVSALTGSVPRKMAEGLQRVSAQSWNRTHVAQLTVTCLNHWAIDSYSEANEWLKGWAKQWALLWLVTSCCKLHWNFISHEIKNSIRHAQNLQIIKTFCTLELSQYCKSGSTFSSQAGCSQQLLQQTRKHPVFVLASQTSPRCAGALPQELGHWFCSQYLQLSSGPGIALGNDRQGLKLGLKLELSSLTNSCKGFICSKIPE